MTNGEGSSIRTWADPLEQARGDWIFTGAKFCEEMRNGVGAEFLEGGIEFGGGAASVAAVFKVEGGGEPLVEGEAIDGAAGSPPGEENPTGSLGRRG